LLHALAHAALRAGLVHHERRGLLLEGVSDRCRARLSEHSRPLDQAFSDVCALARMGGPHLDIWLRNCAFLAREPEARFFEQARDRVASLLTTAPRSPDGGARRIAGPHGDGII